MRFVLPVFILLIFFLISCKGQNNSPTQGSPTQKEKGVVVGGGCDGCEIMQVGIPTRIDNSDTSRGWKDQGQKLVITGTIYQLDGKTPAPGVILYYWHTDSAGFYASRPGLPLKAKRHGYLRGWIKTGDDGFYSIHTIRPAAYPDATEPAHIHFSVQEPDIKNPYYIDDIVFDDDPFLTSEKRNHLQKRGGSGVKTVKIENNYQKVDHNIILGMNIPNYPKRVN